MEDKQYEILQKKWGNANSQKSEMQNYIEDSKQKLEEIEKEIFDIDQKKISFIKQKRAIEENLEIYNSRLKNIEEEISKLNSLMLEKEYNSQNSSPKEENIIIETKEEKVEKPLENKPLEKIQNQEKINNWEKYLGQKIIGKIGNIIAIIGVIMLFVALAPHFSLSVQSKIIMGFILGLGITISSFVLRKKTKLANCLLVLGTLCNVFITIYAFNTIMSDFNSLILMLIFCFGSGIISYLIDGKMLNVFIILALVSPNAVGYSIGEKTSTAYTYIFSLSLFAMGLLSTIRKDFSHILVVGILTIAFQNNAIIVLKENVNYLTFVLPFFALMLSSLIYIKKSNYKIFYSFFLSFWAVYTLAYIFTLEYNYLAILSCSLILAFSIAFVIYQNLNLEIFKFLFAIFLISIDLLLYKLNYTPITFVSVKCIEIFAIDFAYNKSNLLKKYFLDLNTILIILNSLTTFVLAFAYIQDNEKTIQLIGCIIGIVFNSLISFRIKNNSQKNNSLFASLATFFMLCCAWQLPKENPNYFVVTYLSVNILAIAIFVLFGKIKKIDYLIILAIIVAIANNLKIISYQDFATINYYSLIPFALLMIGLFVINAKNTKFLIAILIVVLSLFYSLYYAIIIKYHHTTNNLLYISLAIISFALGYSILKKEKYITYSLIIGLTTTVNMLIGQYSLGKDLVYWAHFVELIFFTFLSKFKKEEFYNNASFGLLIIIALFVTNYICNYHLENFAFGHSSEISSIIFNKNFYFVIAGIISFVTMSYIYQSKIKKTISFYIGYIFLIAITILPHLNQENIYQYAIYFSLLIIVLSLFAISRKQFWHICIAGAKILLFLFVGAYQIKNNIHDEIIINVEYLKLVNISLVLFTLLITASLIYNIKVGKSKIYPYFIAIIPSAFTYFAFSHCFVCIPNLIISIILIAILYFGKKYNKLCNLSQKTILIPIILSLDFFAIQYFCIYTEQVLFIIHSLEIIGIMYYFRNEKNPFYNIISIALALGNIVIITMTYNNIVSFNSLDYIIIWAGALGLTIFAYYQKNLNISIIFMIIGLIYLFSNYYFTYDRINLSKFNNELDFSISLICFLYLICNFFQKSSRYNIISKISNILIFLTILVYSLNLKRYNSINYEIIRPLFNISIILYCINCYFIKIKNNDFRQIVDIILSIIIVAISWIECDLLFEKNIWVSAILAILALIFFFVGFTTKRQHIRYFGIILSGVCSIKLLFYDLSQYSLTTKAVVFLSIGAIFLLISKFYKEFLKNK